MLKSISKAKILENIALIEKFIMMNFNDRNFCVDMMARMFGISVSYLREIIEMNFGMFPRKLIESYRLQKSLELFEKGLNEYLIAQKIGYSYTKSFRRAFIKRFGILTSYFKNMLKLKADVFQSSLNFCVNCPAFCYYLKINL